MFVGQLSKGRFWTFFDNTKLVILDIFLAKKHGIRAVGAIADRRVYAKRNQDARREFIARTVAVADVYLLGRKPRFGGDKIPIKGDASLSWDEAIVSVIKKRQDHTL